MFVLVRVGEEDVSEGAKLGQPGARALARFLGEILDRSNGDWGGYQEKRICGIGIEEDGPADPVRGPSTSTQDFRDCQGGDDTDELVARVGDEVEEL